jgi:hypothetical protein
LQALTWVDPITVVDVELKKEIKPSRRRLQEREAHAKSSPVPRQRRVDQTDWYGTGRHRRLGQKEKTSDFHGTNGFMVHLPKTNEYLGIGHFHRPLGRDANDYARFGHHYTHAFFTIPDEPPYHLQRLTPELVLPSHAHADDAEVIQFWSGLERVDDDTLALAYGINDCEGAATYIDMSTVDLLLRVVPEGKEVVDLMKPFGTSA